MPVGEGPAHLYMSREKRAKKDKKEKKGLLQEFKEFALRGNMVDLAVGIVIGAAFNGIIQSFVDDLIMPLVGLITLGNSFKGFVYTFGDGQVLRYGAFIQTVINFFIIALAVFLVVKVINRMRAAKEGEQEPAPPTETELLADIRDLLKDKG